MAWTTSSTERISPSTGSFWRISPKPGSRSKRTGMGPTFSASVITFRVEVPRSTAAVPSVGWPAKGSSCEGVKMRTRTG